MSSPWWARGNLLLSVGGLVAELISCYFLTLFVYGIFAVTAPLVFGVGLAHGLSVSALAFVLWLRSGALLNPAVTAAKLVCWVTGLHSRDYFGEPSWLSDALYALGYLAAQLGGPLLGALTLRYLDTLDLLPAVVRTTPNGQCDGSPSRAFLLMWLLYTALVWLWLQVSGPRTGVVIKIVGGSIVLGFGVFGCTLLSVYWGTGSFMHFGLDLAGAVVFAGARDNTLWLSMLGALAGALTATLVCWFSLWLDRLLELKMSRGTADANHVRLSLFKQAMNTMLVREDDPLHYLFNVDEPPAGRITTVHTRHHTHYTSPAGF